MENKIILNSLLIFTFIFVLLSINIVSAQQEDVRFYHQIDTNLTIFEKCRVEGAVCDSNFACAVTILSPSEQLIIDNQSMIRGNVYYNFSLNETNSDSNGVYETTVDCTNTTSSGSNTFFYQVTPNGSAPMETSQGIILFISVLMITLIAGLCVSLSFKLNNGWVSLAFLSFAVILMVFAFGMVLNVLELSFGTFSTIINNYSTLYVTFIALVSVGAIGLIVYLIKFALELYWKDRGLIDDGID